MRFSILVNSNLSCFFSSSHGLRQGDPLSHFLFVIVIKALCRMLFLHLLMRGFLSDFSVGSRHCGMVNLSRSLFIDETLVFCEAKPNHLHYPCAFNFMIRSCLRFED